MTEANLARAVARGGTFRALRHRDFRLLWIGLVVSAIGTWMQIVAQALLVLRISGGSAVALGAVSLAQAAAFFTFSLLGGSVADRVDKRQLLLATQTLCMLFAALLGVLTATHVVAVWMIVVLAFLTGTALSFDQPTRAALVSELVPKEELLGALSLQSIVFTGASAIGPALAGFSLATIGYAGNFFANAVSYLAVTGALLAIRPRGVGRPHPHADAARHRRRARRGTRRSRCSRFSFSLFGCAPLLRSVAGAAPAGDGDDGPSRRLGAPRAPLCRVGRGHGPRRPRARLGGRSAAQGAHRAGVGASLVARARGVRGRAARSCRALAALLLLGVFQVGVSATTITLLQTRVARAMRGRVMSLNTLLIMGVRPLGDFGAAAAIGVFGAPPTAIASAVVVAAVALAVTSRPGLHRA